MQLPYESLSQKVFFGFCAGIVMVFPLPPIRNLLLVSDSIWNSSSSAKQSAILVALQPHSAAAGVLRHWAFCTFVLRNSMSARATAAAAE
ncbi:hypothetical protein Pfo_019532 [Paulownia fortunei]|nr:hypothetical protein Pfo_019532 [Paulownia fortunei]